MSDRTLHSEWLSLIDVSGPFLAEPVLKEAFPQGLGGLDSAKKTVLRQAYDEWREARDLDDPLLPKIHAAWIDLVLKRGLELDEQGKADILKPRAALPKTLACTLPEHCITLRPDYAVVDAAGQSLMLVAAYDADVSLTDAKKGDGWAASPAERMVELCRATQVRLGLLTNGEHWMFVDAPVNAATTMANWYARLWGQEPLTLQAFVNLLGIRRFFVDRSEQLPALLDKSLEHQDEVTDALGEQVRRAVEVLIQALERADVDRKRELLEDIEPSQLYEAGLTVMMRIVFLLSAEERGLLLMGDPGYEANYAISTLRLQLRANSDEILERRQDAWSRLLSVFRAVYGGIDHDSMRLPALGGSLFDPDRYPFLEGRAKGSSWRTDSAKPLPIDNRTVLLLLEAVQLFQGRTLSYLALDVEQIGYVYEGLLERTAVRAGEVTLDLAATKNADNPWVTLPELDDAAAKGGKAVEELLKERTGSAVTRVRNDLSKQVDDTSAEKLLAACHGDRDLRDRIKPYFHLLRTDPWGYPLVYPKGTFMVRTGSDRRETGTHYTPRSLTEAIVTVTLEPLVYIGPAEGKSRDEWKLKTPSELLDLKICDPAMGSGAFLVQVCRWHSERLVESWQMAEAQGKAITAEGDVLDALGANEPLRPDPAERLLTAKRLIAERCIYGADLNPLAVELAKLSIWLTTAAKGKPFGFLDHNLRCGDSLLGITELAQLEYLDMAPGQAANKRLFAHTIDEAVTEAVSLRLELRARYIRDIRDVDAMATLNAQMRSRVDLPSIVADALVGEYVAAQGRSVDLTSLSVLAGEALSGDVSKIDAIRSIGHKNLNIDVPQGRPPRRPFHWPLEYPEVFERNSAGFDAIVGNPPFMGNKFWKERLGANFQDQARLILGLAPGKIDLCILFHRRAAELLRDGGAYGLLATDNIAEGSAISVGLGVIVGIGNIFFSKKGMPWPGAAAVAVSIVCFVKGDYAAPRCANGISCDLIGPRLLPLAQDSWEPKTLAEGLFSFEGVNNSKGLAFVVTSRHEWFEALKTEPNSLLVPYITGDDITTHALTRPERWALDIADRSLGEIERDYPVAYRFLSDIVKSTRTAAALRSYKGLIDRWWQFWNHRADLMRRLRGKDDFVAYSKVTKYPICILAPSAWVYTNQVVLIELTRGDEQAICLSSFFRLWLDMYSGGRMEGRLRLSITESISKFPLPDQTVPTAVIDSAREFNDMAVCWARTNGSGMTDVMNAIHDPNCTDAQIERLRRTLQNIDTVISEIYGWPDLDCTYSFVKKEATNAKDKWRFEMAETSLKEIHKRLSALNKQRFENQSDDQAPRTRVEEDEEIEEGLFTPPEVRRGTGSG